MSHRKLFVSSVAVLFALAATVALALPVARAAALDSAPPVLQFQGVSDGGVYGADIAPQVISADADLATLRLALDGAAWASGSLVGAGRHTLVAVASDASGNTTRQSIVFTVDTIAPEFHAFGLDAGSLNVSSGYRDVTFWVDVSDDLSGIDATASAVHLRSPAGEFASAVTPFTLESGDSAGGGAIYVQTLRVPQGAETGVWVPSLDLFDLAGHRATPVASNLINLGSWYQVKVSDTPLPPDAVDATVLWATPDTSTFGAAVTLCAGATDSLDHLITAYEWSSDIDGLLGTSTAPVFTTTRLSVGTHMISLRARCAGGAWSRSVTYSVPIVVTAARSDFAAPTTVSDAKAVYAGSATVSLSATDGVGGSGVAHTYYRLDAGPWVESSVVRATGAGSHRLEFWSVDAQGNSEVTHTVSFTIVTPPPGNGTPTTPSTPSSVRHGVAFTTCGYVVKHATGAYPVTLYFYRYQSGRWVLRTSITAKASTVLTFSTYARSTSVPSSGRWRVRARHTVGPTTRYSAYRYFTAS